MFYHTEQAGYTKKEAMYEPQKLADAGLKVYPPLNLDMVPPLLGVFPGAVMDHLGSQFFKWPGAEDPKCKLDDYLPFQWVEGEYMKENEYEEILTDPTGFLIRKIIPRHHKKLNGFMMFLGLSSLANAYGTMIGMPAFFGMPPIQEMLKSIGQAAIKLFEYIEASNQYTKQMKELGFPVHFNLFVQAPYDVVSESLRGMRGTMLDMYHHPEELKALLQLLVPDSLMSTVMRAKLNQINPENNLVFIPLHRGADGFMSSEQFEEFYWPTLTAIMEGLIKNNLIPCPFFEGGYNDRLEYLGEFAKKYPGKMIYWFDKTDIFRAKELFGNHVAIKGNIPGSLMATGTPQQMEEYVKKIIKGCKEGGGFIVDGGVSGIIDEARPENIKAMVDAVFKYGKY